MAKSKKENCRVEKILWILRLVLNILSAVTSTIKILEAICKYL